MHKTLLAGVTVLLLVTGAAHTKERVIRLPTVTVTRWYGFLQPLKYDKPYTGKLIIRRLETEEEIVTICPKANTKTACAMHSVDLSVCYLFIANDKVPKKYDTSYAFALRHELGHCNGWSAEHENKRKVLTDSVKTMPTLPEDTLVLSFYQPILLLYV